MENKINQIINVIDNILEAKQNIINEIRKIDSTIPEDLTLAGIPPLISTLTANNIIYLTPSLITYTNNTMSSIINDDGILTWEETKGGSSSEDENTTIKSVTIGTDTSSIGARAFNNCVSLISIDIADSVSSIGTGAFNGCTSLTSVYFDKPISEITRLKLTMGNTESDKWWGLSSNTTINCSDGFIYIDKELAYGAKKTILDYNNCDFILYNESTNRLAIGGLNERYTGLTREYSNEIYVPHALVKNQTSSVFPETIGEIFTVANINNKNYNSTPKITIEYGVTNIDSYAFQNCSSVTDIEIPETVESIGAYAFENCNNLTAVTIKGAKYIGSAAFYGCEKLRLQNIILPDGSYSNNPNALTELGDNVFLGLKSEMGPHILQLDGYSVEDANNLFKASNNYAGLPTGSIITLQSGQEIWIGSNNIH